MALRSPHCTYGIIVRGRKPKTFQRLIWLIVGWQQPYKRNAPNKELQGKLEACPMLMTGLRSYVCHLCRLAASMCHLPKAWCCCPVWMPVQCTDRLYIIHFWILSECLNTLWDTFRVFKHYALRNEYLVLFL